MKFRAKGISILFLCLGICYAYAGNDGEPEKEFIEITTEGPEPEELQQTKTEQIQKALTVLSQQAAQIGEKTKELAEEYAPTKEDVQKIMDQITTWYSSARRFAGRFFAPPIPETPLEKELPPYGQLFYDFPKKEEGPPLPPRLGEPQVPMVPGIPPALPVRFTDVFEQIFTSDSTTEEQLTSYQLNKKFEEFRAQLPTLGFKSLSEFIAQQQSFIVNRSIELNKQINAGNIDVKQAIEDLTNLYLPLIRLYYVVAASLTTRFDGKELYKGGLSYDNNTYLVLDIFTQDEYDVLLSIQKMKELTQSLVQQAINPLDYNPDLYERVKKLYQEKAFFRVDPENINSTVLLNWLATAFEQKMEPSPGIFQEVRFYFLFNRLQKYREIIKKGALIYQSWIGYYPALSENASPLEQSWRQELQRNIKAQEQTKQAMQEFLGIVLRSSPQREAERILSRIATIYKEVTKETYKWPKSYKEFVASMQDNYQRQYASLQELKRTIPIEPATLANAVKEALRYVIFETYQQFSDLKTELLSTRVIKPAEAVATQQDVSMLDDLDEEISALVKKYRQKEKVDISELKDKIKKRNELAKQLGESDKFTKVMVELQFAGI